MSHYQTLGVSANASTDEIKKAFRKRASKAHSDRGGSDSEMAVINQAYAVLSDPRRRLIYDEKGSDGKEPLDVQAREMLASMFAQAINEDMPDLVLACREALAMHRDEISKQLRNAPRKRELYLKQRDKVRAKKGPNMVHVLVDRALVDIDALIENRKEELEVIAMVFELLANYESVSGE
jgi:DnaJ-class molecular chaperone